MEKQRYTISGILNNTHEGILVVGDVHGNSDSFEIALEYAAENSLFLIQLGDLVDRGKDSVSTIRLATEMVHSGRGLFLKGNHDWKHLRYIEGRNVVLNNEYLDTVSQFRRDEASLKCMNEWYEISTKMPFVLIVDSGIFAHAGYHKSFLSNDNDLKKYALTRALYGEVDSSRTNNDLVAKGLAFPARRYEWCNEIPDSHKMFVGHAVISNEYIPRVVNSLGGEVYFTDTGAGFKDGKLSWIHLDRSMRVVGSSTTIVDIDHGTLPS